MARYIKPLQFNPDAYALRLHPLEPASRSSSSSPTPTPGPGEVLLRVDAAGLCHSDLHLMEWPEGSVPFTLPFTLGHETAGTVAALGPGVDRRRAKATAWWSTRAGGASRCWPCLAGRRERLRALRVDAAAGYGGGVGRDGGLAEYMIVPSARYLIPIDGLDPAYAAPLTDAALTPYHALQPLRHATAARRDRPGHRGRRARPHGHPAAPGAQRGADRRGRRPGSGARARARRRRRRRPCRRSTSPRPHLRSELGGNGVDVVLDCVASDATLALAAGSVAVGGDLCYLGRGGGSLSVAPGTLPFECSVMLPSWGTLPELVEVVALARVGGDPR